MSIQDPSQERDRRSNHTSSSPTASGPYHHILSVALASQYLIRRRTTSASRVSSHATTITPIYPGAAYQARSIPSQHHPPKPSLPYGAHNNPFHSPSPPNRHPHGSPLRLSLPPPPTGHPRPQLGDPQEHRHERGRESVDAEGECYGGEAGE